MNFEKYLRETLDEKTNSLMNESEAETLLALTSFVSALYVSNSVSNTISNKARKLVKSVKGMYDEMIANQKFSKLNRELKIFMDNDLEVIKMLKEIKATERGHKRAQMFLDLIKYLEGKMDVDDLDLLKTITRELIDY